MKPSKEIKNKKNKLLLNSIIMVIMTIIFTTFLVLSCYKLKWRLDLTEQRLFTLTEETTSVLEELNYENKDIKIAAVYATGHEETMVIELLKEYEKNSDHINFEVIDAEREPFKLADYQMGDVKAIYNGSIIVESGTRVKIISNQDIFGTIDSSQIFYGERELTGAIRYVTAKNLPHIYYLTGHGEITPDSQFTKAVADITRNAYAISTLVILQEGIPEDAEALIMASPIEDITKEEYDKLSEFMEQGGKLFLSVDPVLTGEQNILENINLLCNSYGIDISNNYVVEENSSYYLTTNNMFLIPRFSSHEITAAIGEGERMVIMPIVRGIGAVDYDNKRITQSILLQTSDKAWSRNDVSIAIENKMERDIGGPIVLGMAAEKTNTGSNSSNSRLVVYGDSDFFTDANYNMQANSVLFMNSINWLFGDKVLTSINGKSITTTSLLVRGDTFIRLAILSCVILPLILFTGAVFTWYMERSR